MDGELRARRRSSVCIMARVFDYVSAPVAMTVISTVTVRTRAGGARSNTICGSGEAKR